MFATRGQIFRSALIWGVGSGLLTQAVAYFGNNFTLHADTLAVTWCVGCAGACLGGARAARPQADPVWIVAACLVIGGWFGVLTLVALSIPYGAVLIFRQLPLTISWHAFYWITALSVITAAFVAFHGAGLWPKFQTGLRALSDDEEAAFEAERNEAGRKGWIVGALVLFAAVWSGLVPVKAYEYLVLFGFALIGGIVCSNVG